LLEIRAVPSLFLVSFIQQGEYQSSGFHVPSSSSIPGIGKTLERMTRSGRAVNAGLNCLARRIR
jgi:hypothetical protein